MNELEKNSKTHESRVIINEFLEWLSNKGICLAKWGRVETVDRLFSCETRNQELLDEFFNINSKKLEKERRVLLESLRRREQT